MPDLEQTWRLLRWHSMVKHDRYITSLQLAQQTQNIPGAIVECLPGDALVSLPAGRTVRAMRRSYSGPMIKITTAGGDQLTATPNHPILTGSGWVLAGAVQEGSYVISRTRLERMGIGHPHVDDVPTPIGEVFEALQGRQDERGPLHPVDLDVRARRGEVQVVAADRQLALSEMTPFGEPFRQENFASAHLGSVSFPSNGLGCHRCLTSAKPLPGLRTKGQCRPDIRVTLHTADHGIAPRSFGIPSSTDSLADRATVASIFGGENTDGLTSEVAADRIVSVRTFPYSDHVFNLQTTTGWYNANNIIVHNCGVWRGGMVAGIAHTLGNDRNYYLYDSFEGLPAANLARDGRKAVTLTGRCRAEEHYAHEAMRLAGITNYSLNKGWFHDTLPKAKLPDGIALLRLDGDWYDSTMTCLENLYPRLNPAGICIIDDYYVWPGCKQAIHDYTTDTVQHTGKDPVAYIRKD